MGVPKFKSLLPPHALDGAEVTKIPHIKNAYFDMNNLYWRVIRGRNADKAFFAVTQSRINETYRRFKPSNLVYFAIDGASPIAKIHLQRDRRINANNGKLAVNPLQLSPGTDFLEKLKDHLCHVGAGIVDNSHNPNMEVIISGGGTPDEGELKIFRHINTYSTEGNNLVVGGDSDLFLYALRSPASVYLFHDETLELISIDKMKSNLLKDVTTPKSKEQNCIDDFVFLSLLLGNDYLPRLRYYNLQSAWYIYLELKRRKFQTENLFSEHHVIHHDFASDLFQDLDDNAMHVVDVLNKHPMQPKSVLFELFQMWQIGALVFDTVEKDGKWKSVVKCSGADVGSGVGENKRQAEAVAANNALMSDSIFDAIKEFPERIHGKATAIVKNYRLHKTQGNDQTVEDRKVDLVYDYLEGLGWSMQYYKGECVNYGYHYPHQTSPSMKSIVKHKLPVSISKTAHPPLSTLEVLMAILPHTAKQFVPTPYSKLYEEDSPLKHLFIDSQGNSKSWDKKEVLGNMKTLKQAILSLGETIREHEPPVQIIRAKEDTHQDWKFVRPVLPDWNAKPLVNPLLCKVEHNNTFVLKENKYMQQVIKRKFSTGNNNFAKRAFFKNVLSFVKI